MSVVEGIPPPEGPDENQGWKLVVVSSVLELIALILLGGRVYTRLRPNFRLWWDDYTIILSMALATITWILLLLAIKNGLGRHNYYLSAEQSTEAAKYLFIQQPFWAWALSISKVSIALLLLRINRDSRPWRMSLYLMIALLLLIAAAINVFQFSTCRPLTAVWDKAIPGATCLPREVVQVSIYVLSSLTIVTDFILALIPINFILKLVSLRPREKAALGVVMALGLIAGIGGIIKTLQVKSYGVNGDTLWQAMGIALWSEVELYLR
ncbi:hypothetical protein B0J13DRAFT_459745 [Dactylonectria estremocensis]|uniref:Rhodopsin domain-containing protein n=1 Tax=Dactylonectria estremocensis TaxID=1079267 RepID=A0A9P9ID40_9HYPO|nr:hypothetical protein B0J13DRAFT_459745 [Dactylonectria estremocensis]